MQVRELTPPEDSSITEIDLTVPAAKAMQVSVDPVAVTAGKRANFSVIAENTGNTIIAGRLGGDDPEGKVGFAFDPEIVTLAPGEHAVVDMRARARRRFTGSPVVRMLGLYLDEVPPEAFFNDPDNEVKGPRGEAGRRRATPPSSRSRCLTRGALSLLGLLVAVTVFALVITLALGRLVGQTTADRDLALQVAAARTGGGATGTSGVAGTVKLLGASTPLGAVSVSVFDASDTTKPLVTTATDSQGSYQVSQLAAGKYKLSFKRAGYVTLWYPAATSDADATTVDRQGRRAEARSRRRARRHPRLDQRHRARRRRVGLDAVSRDDSGHDRQRYADERIAHHTTASDRSRHHHGHTPTATTPAPNPLNAGAAIVQKVAGRRRRNVHAHQRPVTRTSTSSSWSRPATRRARCSSTSPAARRAPVSS